MQKYCLSVLLLLLFGRLQAQEFAVMLDKMNVLYVGVDNSFQVVVSDVPRERLVLSPSQGSVYWDSIGHRYRWSICESRSNKAALVISDTMGEAALDTLFFRVAGLPEPHFEWAKGGYHAGGGITGFFEGYCSEYLRPVITGFDLTYIAKKQDAMVIHNTGARYEAGAASMVNRLKPGDRIFITGITWRAGCDPTVRKSEEVLFFEAK